MLARAGGLIALLNFLPSRPKAGDLTSREKAGESKPLPETVPSLSKPPRALNLISSYFFFRNETSLG